MHFTQIISFLNNYSAEYYYLHLPFFPQMIKLRLRKVK